MASTAWRAARTDSTVAARLSVISQGLTIGCRYPSRAGLMHERCSRVSVRCRTKDRSQRHHQHQPNRDDDGDPGPSEHECSDHTRHDDRNDDDRRDPPLGRSARIGPVPIVSKMRHRRVDCPAMTRRKQQALSTTDLERLADTLLDLAGTLLELALRLVHLALALE